MAIPTLGAMIAAIGSPAEWVAVATSKLYWDDVNGRLGVGVSAPGGKLEVAHAAASVLSYLTLYSDGTTDSAYLSMRRSNSDTLGTLTATVNGQILGTLDFEGVVSGGTWRTSSYIRAIQLGAAGASHINSRIGFFTGTDSASATENLTILGSGDVGIGTTEPAYSVDVAAATAVIRLDSTTGTNAAYYRCHNTGGDFYFGRERSTTGGLLSGDTAYAGVLAVAGTYPLQFGVNNALVMQLTSGGNVGIGVDPYSVRFRVKSPSTTAGEFAVWAENSSNTRLFSVDNAGTGYILTNPWTYSDRKNKENIISITDYATDKIKLLKPTKFDLKGDGPKNNLGFMADEVQSIIPEAVAINEFGEPGELMINTSHIIPYVVKSVQEIIDRLEKLDKKSFADPNTWK